MRQSNIELLRLVAILLIVLMHGAGCAAGTSSPGNAAALTALNAVGNMGVTVFVFISGYFGIRFRVARLSRLWLKVAAYSVLGTAVALAAGVEQLPDGSRLAGRLAAMLTPVSSGRWWFITDYVLLFCVSPLADIFVRTVPRRAFRAVLLVLSVLFLLLPTAADIVVCGPPSGKSFPNLLLAYLAGRYAAVYGFPRLFERHSGVIFAVCALAVFARGMSTGSPFVFARDNNPLVFAGAVALFCTFRKHAFCSPAVNRAATYALPVYLFSDTLQRVVRPLYCGVTDLPSFFPVMLAVNAGVVVAVVAVETVMRRLTDRAAGRLSERLEEFFAPRR